MHADTEVVTSVAPVTTRARWARPGIALVLAGLLLWGPFHLGPARAGADTVSSLQDEAAQVSHELNVEQSDVAIDQQRYSAIDQKVHQDEQQLALMQTQMAVLRSRTASDARHLRQVAIETYVTAGEGSDALTELFSTNQSDAAAGNVYEETVAGNLSASVDDLQTDRQLLQAQEAGVQRLAAQDEADRATAADILGEAQVTTQQLGHLDAQVTGQLAAAVAQARAAQAAAAAAAVQRAQASATPVQALAALSGGGARTSSAASGSTSASTDPPAADPGPSDPATASSASSPDTNTGPWERVALCEESGEDDPTYGYFGITPQSWATFGGTQYSGTAGGATWDEQVLIAEKISGGNVPDANGCSSW